MGDAYTLAGSLATTNRPSMCCFTSQRRYSEALSPFSLPSSNNLALSAGGMYALILTFSNLLTSWVVVGTV